MWRHGVRATQAIIQPSKTLLRLRDGPTLLTRASLLRHALALRHFAAAANMPAVLSWHFGNVGMTSESVRMSAAVNLNKVERFPRSRTCRSMSRRKYGARTAAFQEPAQTGL